MLSFNCKNLTVKCIFIAILSISIRAIKFEEITVTFHPINPKDPIMIITEVAQPINGIKTHLRFLKINQRVKIINKKTPIPKTIISLLMKLIISSAIIGIPPRWILAFSPYFFTPLISEIF